MFKLSVIGCSPCLGQIFDPDEWIKENQTVYDSETAKKVMSCEKELLKKGDKGPCVKFLQDRLSLHGFSIVYNGGYGTFGPKTEKAVKNFQSYHKLKVDGKVGKETWSMLVYTPQALKVIEEKLPPKQKEEIKEKIQKKEPTENIKVADSETGKTEPGEDYFKKTRAKKFDWKKTAGLLAVGVGVMSLLKKEG